MNGPPTSPPEPPQPPDQPPQPPDQPPQPPDQPPQPPDQPPAESPQRLDPDRAAAAARARRRPEPEPVIDTRPYRWTIGIFALVLLIAFTIYTFVSRGVGTTTGVAPGHRLHLFVAPLADSGLTGAANVQPKCDPAHPNPQALNVCGRRPLVLGLFATGSNDCRRQIDTLQTVSRQFAPRRVQFAAVAVSAGRNETRALVRSHHWTIPVAFDPDGAVGALYGVAICPMVEIARNGGVVTDRLIGNRWIQPAALAARVRAMLGEG